MQFVPYLDEIINFMANSTKVLPHLHVPLQSGSNNILKLMKRRYDAALYASKIKKIKNLIITKYKIKKIKVGHAGTLDPFAEGVLMLCIGSFTKKVESFMNKEKEYITDIRLGEETDTLDLTGKIIKTSDIKFKYRGSTIIFWKIRG